MVLLAFIFYIGDSSSRRAHVQREITEFLSLSRFPNRKPMMRRLVSYWITSKNLVHLANQTESLPSPRWDGQEANRYHLLPGRQHARDTRESLHLSETLSWDCEARKSLSSSSLFHSFLSCMTWPTSHRDTSIYLLKIWPHASSLLSAFFIGTGFSSILLEYSCPF